MGFSGDFIKKSPIYPVSPIYRRFLAKNRPADLSPPFVVLPPADTRYIGDISPIFSDFFFLGYKEFVNKTKKLFSLQLVYYFALHFHS